MTEKKAGAVLVVGAGVGGIRAAFDLAESGFKVYLVDKNPGLGGTITQLDKWFPDNQCEMCKLLPVFSRDECSQFCLRRDIYHPNIELVPNTVIDKVEGEAGNFKVSVTTGSRLVKLERCTACGLCTEVCPVEVPDEFNEGLQNRKAIYVRNPQAIPNIFTIDRDNCTKCGKCIEVCPTDAIDLELADESRQLEVGAVIVSSGFDEFDSSIEMGQYGFGRYPNVLNNIQLERLLSSNGKTEGRLLRPSDDKTPKNVTFMQCVGSRDMKRNYCSAACCMYALKESILIKEKYPDIEVTIFYMDMRAFGKDYHRYYMKAQELGVNFTRCRVSTFRQEPRTKNLTLVARAEDGSLISSEFELAVLSVAQCPSTDVAGLFKVLGVDLNQWGFVKGQEFSQVKTSREGIYVCGSAAAPADISETVIQASAAASEASALLFSTRNQTAKAKKGTVKPEPGDGDIKTAVFLCKCGDIIPSVIDMEKVADSARRLPNVVSVEEVDYICLPESIDKLKDAVRKSGANRVIIAACSPYRYYRLFTEALQDAGIDPSLWQLVNFREQLAWVHPDSQVLATEKALSMLAVAAQKLRSQELLPVLSTPVNKNGLVIGGGVSGLVSALSLAGQGFEVHLVEKTGELGGHVRDMYLSLGNTDPQKFIKDIIGKAESNKNIHIHLNSEVTEVFGHAGNYKSTIKTSDEVNAIGHGVIIVATGAQAYQPTEYQYGKDERIITQKELQKKLSAGKLDNVATVVMIQCVGSRDEVHPYCNRSCCSEAIAGALKIKEQSPETEVVILNRDIMTYAFKEEYYTKAREAGVLFFRYEPGKEPEVKVDGKVVVTVSDPSLPGKLEIDADLLALSTGIVAEENREMAEMLSLSLTADGFFKEVDIKFRPVDAVIDGIFICGRASAPRNLEEEITQAEAAAQRAANVLARETLESGRIVSEVNTRRCSGCALCVTTCPFDARWLDEENKVAVVEEALCQGCGTCVAVCPNSAAKLRGMKDSQVFSMIDAAL